MKLDEAMTTEGDGERSDIPTSYKEFLEKIGEKYRYAKPQHYLGGTVSIVDVCCVQPRCLPPF
jgi:hypothetical protein